MICHALGMPPFFAPLFMTATRGCTACTSTAGPDRFKPWCVVR